MRVLQYNKPKYHVFLACLGALLLGMPQAAMAYIMSKFMIILALPVDMYEEVYGMESYYWW